VASRYSKDSEMRFKVVEPKQLAFFLSQQSEEEDYFYIPAYRLFVFSRLDKEGYKLAFVLDKKVRVDSSCDKIEQLSVLITKRDIPWRGFEKEFLLGLTAVDCTKGVVVPTLRVNIFSGDTIFHWDQIANIIMGDELFNYLDWLKSNYGINYQVLDT